MTDKRFEITFNDIDFHLKDNETGEELKLVDEKVCYDYIADRWNALHEENQELKSDVYDWKASAEDYLKLGKSLKKENEQLQERNNRQAKQLDNLYTLIEKQEWKTLTGLIQEFQECEEQRMERL